VPIAGEAGVGYLLPKGFDLPPLMFDTDELRALALGAHIVMAWGDERLAGSAERALERITAVAPKDLRGALDDSPLLAPSFHVPKSMRAAVATLRAAIDQKRKVSLAYNDAKGAPSTRVVRPLGLSFWGHVWSLAAYCELRADLRHFRLDRITGLQALDEPFVDEPGRQLSDFLRRVEDGQ
jgi:predicted DNA-binding transcriptional regulator YafY